ADVDGDGDLDILGAADVADDITWWENDGSQNFTEHTIDGGFDGANDIAAADVDGDGDMDVLGTGEYIDGITWWENDGSQNFSEHTITEAFDRVQALYTADVDGDGDLDVLGAAFNDDEIAVWYNVVPEIAVAGNGTEISNGDTSPTTADDTDFDNVTLGDTLTHTFTISNNGTSATDDLILSGSSAITLSNGTAFTVTQPAST
ncbi:MAG: VCBS repeat-containing protein, partial [Anaerolineae bacterium]|nr:VCBS repeat-containing protein [Anaerolineae bacterium]